MDVQKKKISSKDLGINLKSGKEEELFKWFLACLLFGKPIQQEVAKRTYFEFKKQGILSPDEILKAGWDRLVEVLDRGHYVRYDFSTATKLLEISKELKHRYGSLSNLLNQSKNKKDLAIRLQEFKGIGPVTTMIFLRGLGRRKMSKRAKRKTFGMSKKKLHDLHHLKKKKKIVM